MTINTSAIQQLYIAYFNRPADRAGLAFWETQVANNGDSTVAVSAAFSESAEYKAAFEGMDSDHIVAQIYLNLFGRPAEMSGLKYWSDKLSAGDLNISNVVTEIGKGAVGSDLTAYTNKTTAAVHYSDAMDTVPEILSYSNPAAGSVAKAYISGVTDDASLATAIAPTALDATIAKMVAMYEGNADGVFTLTDSVAAGVKTMHISGDQTVRIDLTNSANQIKGLDLNGDGIIAADGKENALDVHSAAGYVAVDAYTRASNGVLNETDLSNNFIGDIKFDGSGYAGDGVNTDGNIFLGGLGADTALGGLGNDFMAGGGVATGRFVDEVNAQGNLVIRDTLFDKIVPGTRADVLSGGRNADFFFAEFSKLDATDGNLTTYDGGTTTDDAAAGLAEALSGVNSQNNDWLLVEASDDDEPVAIILNGSGTNGGVTTSQGASAVLKDIESVDASGNLYGHLNDIDVKLGARATDARSTNPVAGTENFGIGSSAQLDIQGSAAANVIIAGYDNDKIVGNDGDDILMGGNLKYLLTNKNNPNLLNATGGLDLNVSKVGTVTDGRDDLNGGADNDSIVFEMDGGKVDGGVDLGTSSGADIKVTGDTLYMTDFTMGRVQGATVADEATAQADALAKVTTDKTVRIDLGNDGVAAFKSYGGSNAATQDATNYAVGVKAVTMIGMESVIATGLGAIDFKAAGANSPELAFNNQQNFLAINADLNLRGSGKDNTLYANTGKDVLEGRGGDDNLSGGTADDDFVFAYGDGVDTVHRQKDANGDNLWDTDATTGEGLFVQDFRTPQTGDISSSRLTIDFGATDLTSVNVSVTSFTLKIGTVVFSVSDAAALFGAKSATDLATVVNNAYKAIDANVSVTAVGNTLVVVDKVGHVISSTIPEGYAVGVVLGSGLASTVPTFAPGGTPINVVENDRVIFKDYASRANNLGSDAAQVEINDAAALTTKLGTDGSQLATAQQTLIRVTDAQQGDKVTVTVNGKEFSYTAKAGETSSAVIAGLAAAINADLDTNSAAGKLAASASTPADAVNFPDLPLDAQTGVPLAQTGAQLSLTQTAVSGSMTYMDVTVKVANALTGSSAAVATHDQSGNNINLLGFDGRNGNLNGSDVLFTGLTSDSKSLLQTAKNAGETLTGMDANAVAGTPAAKWINGDDLLIGGDGNDIVNAGTGDDRILVSKGTDTVDGGAKGSSPINFVDTLQAEEATFGTGTHFTVTLDGTLGAVGAGTVQALSATNVALGTTSFTNIEAVRVLENNRNSSLDVKTLSDNVAAAVGANALASEGLTVNLLAGNADVTYTVDLNNDGSITGAAGAKSPDYNAFKTTATFGAENLLTGGANDIANLDESQTGANNNINLGAQQNNAVALTEGFDTVNYLDTAAVLAAAQTTVTLKVEASANTDTVTLSGGALGSLTTVDTLTDAEHINFNVNSASSEARADTLDLSKIAGATVNFGGGAETVQKSLGGANALTTVGGIDANTLATGGVAITGNGLGNELLEIGNITRFEKVIGSAGTDRVIVANTLLTGAGVATDLVPSLFTYATGSAPASFNDIGLYQFDLAAGGNDMLDYKQETGLVAVIVDTSATAAAATSSDFVVTGGLGARVDVANNVERYLGGSSGFNAIDLSNATVDSTVQFSKEAFNNTVPNEFAESNGNDTVTTTDLTRGNEVRDSATGTVFANFVDRTAANPAGASFWNNVYGAAKNETVVFTDNETAVTHTMALGAGKNVVDYSALTTAVTASLGSTSIATADHAQSILVNGDSVNQFHNETDVNASYATINGSARSGDNVDVTGFVFRTVGGSTAATASLSSVSPRYHVVDLSAGIVTEDPAGQYGTLTNLKKAGFVTHVSSFENASNAGDLDAVHLIGTAGANSLTGGDGNDQITGGNGTGTAGNGGDTLTGGAGKDSFIYSSETQSPGGNVTGGQQSASVFASDTAVANSRDTITDFVTGTDDLVFNINDSFNSVKVTGALPADLSGALNSVGALTTTFVAGTVNVNINQTGAATAAGVQNYQIATTGATLAIGDVVLNVAGSSGGDIIDASAGLATTALSVDSLDGLQVNVVYAAASESQGGTFDTLIHFNSGTDKIDLSFLKATEWAVSFGAAYDSNIAGGDGFADATQAIRVLASSPLVAFNSDAPGLFVDAGGQMRAVAMQTTANGLLQPSVTLFVDANHDGNYVVGQDMVISVVGVASVDIADFIFDNY
jgi:hypothetical protein